MRHWIYATAASVSLILLGAVGQANALPVDRFTPAAVPGQVEQVQFFFGGRDYCWYDDGWRGPGFYWCGYAWRRGLGWGGGWGWHGWHGGHRHVGPGHHGGPVVGRPVGRPAMGRPPGGGRPAGMARPGGGGGGRPGAGHGGGGHGHR